jgi:cell division protein FtsI (penicillin-binding protein 3)
MSHWPDDELRPPPSPHAAPAGRPLPSGAAARPAAHPREVVRIAAPELVRRAQLEKSRGRLVVAAGGFALLFGAVGLKLAFATLIDPMTPKLRPAARMPTSAPIVSRAPIVDRNGEVLAVSLRVTELYANPQEINHPEAAADRLLEVLPDLDREQLIARISRRNVPGTDRPVEFAYLARNLAPRQQQAINDLGVAGFHFQPAERRFYPQGSAAVHVLGQVDVDGKGIAGVEHSFDERLRTDHAPLRLSLDVRVQVALRESVQKAIADFNGIGGAGVVLDVHTAEVLAMVSLPDYDVSDPDGVQRRGAGSAVPVRPGHDPKFNRATVGLYEPGSTFKLFTAAMALDSGTANIWSSFDASRPIRYGRFTISDYRGKNRSLRLPEVLAYSSNLGAAHMAMGAGPARQREFMGQLGMLSRVGIELPETARPMAPGPQRWRDINTMTIGFGHGISVTPLHVVNGVSALANGGVLRQPTLLAQPPGAARDGVRVISERTSETMRRLMRLVVTEGSGKGAEVPGYFVGGKTGTAQKTGPRGGYLQDKRIAAFVGAFPLNQPRYALYVMVDEPRPNAQSHGFATAGWVAAPAAGAVIRRIAPILGMVPETDRAPQIQEALAIPLQPGRPPRTESPAVAGAPRNGIQAPPRNGTPATPRGSTPAAAPPRVLPLPAVRPPDLAPLGAPPALRQTDAAPLPARLRLAVAPAPPREAGLAGR